jgi:predicted ATPase/DNA-binding SARP family transcriptional activator
LGGVDVTRGGAPVAGFRSAKAQALFCYLAVTGRPVARTTLANLFWGDQAEEQARTNLNQALSNLRKVVGEALAIDRYTAAFTPGANDFIDTEALSCAARDARQLHVEELLAAAALYRGDLLAGFQVRDAAEFESWLQTARTRLRDAAVTVLIEAARSCEERNDQVRAEQALRSLLQIEPWREHAHRELMLLLTRSGRRDAALAQFAACRAALAAALDVEPDSETVALYQRIRSGLFAGERPTAPSPRLTQESLASPTVGTPMPAALRPVELPHNLPPQTTPFIGRTRELAEIVSCLLDPECRLLTLVGPGGIGKSRLAHHAVLAVLSSAMAQSHFADGAYYVPLASVTTLNATVAAVAQATGLQFYDNSAPEDQLRAYLQPKRMLLLLDNLEQLLTGWEMGSLLTWLSEITASAPQVKLLVTTREALSLQEAWFYPIGGLSLPRSRLRRGDAADPLTDLEESDAVQLFMQCARRAKVGFSLSATHAAVTRICRLVDGTPLGIELAAAWLKALTADQIATELEQNLDILTARHTNLPARHRSMRAVCEASWQLLAEPLRAVMQRLALCRGGFRLEAAAHLAGASILDLTTLVEKALLRQLESGRYEMHELLRHYALERLAAQGDVATARLQHARYYLEFLQRHGAALRNTAQRQALEELTEEQENVHVAWRAAAAAHEWDLLHVAYAALYDYLQVRSAYLEGLELFTAAAEALADDVETKAAKEAHRELHMLLVQLRTRQGAFSYLLGDHRIAAQVVAASLAEARTQGFTGATAFALNLLGQIVGWQGQRDVARAYLEESLAHARALGEQAGIATTLHKLAQVHGSVGEYAEARRLAQESLELCRQLGRPDWIGYAHDVLGWATLCLGDYTACRTHYTASLRLFRDIGDSLGIALSLGGLGSVEWALGGDRLLPAAAYMTESLNLCRRIGHRHHAASRLWYLGQIAVEQEDYSLAQAYAEEGRALAEEVGSKVFVAYNLCSLGEAQSGLGRRASAQLTLTSVLRIASEVAHLPPLLIALIGLARLELASPAGTTREHASRRELALASLRLVTAHPACWHPYRVRAQGLRSAATGFDVNGADVAAPPRLEEIIDAWLAWAEGEAGTNAHL